MDIIDHKLNVTPLLRCDDFKSLVAVRGKDYSCLKCGEQEDDYQNKFRI